MKVRRYNFASQFPDALPSLIDDLQQILLDGDYVLGRPVELFERHFADFLGARYATGVNSGTDALLLTFMALGIGRGDEVITQANTFHATGAAICLAGATPVLVDADDTSFLIDTDQLGSAVTGETAAIVPVHLFGKPSPMSEVLKIAQNHGIPVVEDAAQSHGARIGGRRTGTLGIAGCFSFHPSKNLAAAGDAGAIVTNDPQLDEALRSRRSLGQSAPNQHVSIGLNSKLDVIQARILDSKLPLLDSWNARRREIAASYRAALTDLPLRFQAEDPGEEHVYHLFQTRTEHRDRLLDHLVSCGVEATVRYPTPVHLQAAFSDHGWQHGQFPVAEALANELVCLPIRPDMTDQEVEYTAERIRGFFVKR